MRRRQRERRARSARDGRDIKAFRLETHRKERYEFGVVYGVARYRRRGIDFPQKRLVRIPSVELEVRLFWIRHGDLLSRRSRKRNRLVPHDEPNRVEFRKFRVIDRASLRDQRRRGQREVGVRKPALELIARPFRNGKHDCGTGLPRKRRTRIAFADVERNRKNNGRIPPVIACPFQSENHPENNRRRQGNQRQRDHAKLPASLHVTTSEQSDFP